MKVNMYPHKKNSCWLIIGLIAVTLGCTAVSIYLLTTNLFLESGNKIVKVIKTPWTVPDWEFAGFKDLTNIIDDMTGKTFLNASVCFSTTCTTEDLRIGDGVCHSENDYPMCCFDGGDCASNNCASIFVTDNDMICDHQDQTSCNGVNNDCQDFYRSIMDQLCSECSDNLITNASSMGDQNCNESIADSANCCFDGGDCITKDQGQEPVNQPCSLIAGYCLSYEVVQACSTCPNGDHSGLDGICSDNLIDDPTCCYDALDCFECHSCPRPSFVADNYCDIDFLTESCCLDGGDCNHHTVNASGFCADCHFDKYRPLIGDGTCHMELANHPCCFDGGDCLSTRKNSRNWCSSCTSYYQGVYYDIYLSNGICEEQYNRPECCFDGEDCLGPGHNNLCSTCTVDRYQSYVTNKRCDNAFNSMECCFDGGFCDVDICPTCLDERLKLKINDGVCDLVLTQMPQCCNDRDDCVGNVQLTFVACTSCQVTGVHSFLANHQCDDFMNNFRCCFDGGDCETNLAKLCNDCDNPSIPLTAGDVICDLSTRAEHMCCYDGGDCLKWETAKESEFDDFINDYFCVHCASDSSRIGNGVCDDWYNNVQCCFDGNDCITQLTDCPFLYAMRAGDGFCDVDVNRREYCNLDEGDCGWSTICDISCSRHFDGVDSVQSQIQDGTCQESLEIEECCYDGGDCPCPGCRCPTCPVQLESIYDWLGDMVCDPKLDHHGCCYDLGDCWCTSCLVDTVDILKTMIGNHQCDLSLNNEDCCFDFGDCDIHVCNTCPITHINRIEDGLCDRYLYNEACCFDGYDCEGTDQRCPTCVIQNEVDAILLGNRYCTSHLNHEDCCFDLGDCAILDDICPTCAVSSYVGPLNLGDGICDYDYKTIECCFDNNDCVMPNVCPTCETLSNKPSGNNPFNGICDPKLNSTDCCFDGGDCYIKSSLEDACFQSCKTEFTTEIKLGNFLCDPHLLNNDCCYDLNDCDPEYSLLCPTCKLTEEDHLSLKISNFYCNPDLNSTNCCFDSGDCFQDRFQCPTCDLDMSWFRDSYCDVTLNNLDCCYDGGDCSCPTCPLQEAENADLRFNWYQVAVGNFQCDRVLDTPECCFDGFDCRLTSSLCPTCTRHDGIMQFLLGDGVCQPELFYNMACCFDVGDCDGTISSRCNTCKHANIAWLGDGYCDKDLYFAGVNCCWDLGDCALCGPSITSNPIMLDSRTFVSCLDPIQQKVAVYFTYHFQCETCLSLMDREQCKLLGDSNCHKELLNADSCFDGGDCWCPLCNDNDWNLRVGDGVCNTELLTETCCFDKGDCSHKSNSSLVCPSCGQRNGDSLITNGHCDSFLHHDACCFDGGDCGCPTCPLDQNDIGNGKCDRELETLDCCHDGGDCRCLQVTLAFDECCPESGSKWCFPPNSLCPTCSLDLSQRLYNGRCDITLLGNDDDCCFDSVECVEKSEWFYVFANDTTYEVSFSYLDHHFRQLDLKYNETEVDV